MDIQKLFIAADFPITYIIENIQRGKSWQPLEQTRILRAINKTRLGQERIRSAGIWPIAIELLQGGPRGSSHDL